MLFAWERCLGVTEQSRNLILFNPGPTRFCILRHLHAFITRGVALGPLFLCQPELHSLQTLCSS